MEATEGMTTAYLVMPKSFFIIGESVARDARQIGLCLLYLALTAIDYGFIDCLMPTQRVPL
jgi:hypothetical protein